MYNGDCCHGHCYGDGSVTVMVAVAIMVMAIVTITVMVMVMVKEYRSGWLRPDVYQVCSNLYVFEGSQEHLTCEIDLTNAMRQC